MNTKKNRSSIWYILSRRSPKGLGGCEYTTYTCPCPDIRFGYVASMCTDNEHIFSMHPSLLVETEYKSGAITVYWHFSKPKRIFFLYCRDTISHIDFVPVVKKNVAQVRFFLTIPDFFGLPAQMSPVGHFLVFIRKWHFEARFFSYISWANVMIEAFC